jgi:hypothetical protein
VVAVVPPERGALARLERLDFVASVQFLAAVRAYSESFAKTVNKYKRCKYVYKESSFGSVAHSIAGSCEAPKRAQTIRFHNSRFAGTRGVRAPRRAACGRLRPSDWKSTAELLRACACTCANNRYTKMSIRLHKIFENAGVTYFSGCSLLRQASQTCGRNDTFMSVPEGNQRAGRLERTNVIAMLSNTGCPSGPLSAIILE